MYFSQMNGDKLIVLDLDETLFHCDILEPLNGDYDYKHIDKDGRNIRTYYTTLRPHVSEFIDYLNNNFKYGIYTAATEDYAQIHINKLGLNPLFLKHRENCTLKYNPNGWQYYLKRLSKLKKFGDINKMIAIDDKLVSFSEDRGNLIKVDPFYGHPMDNTLEKLIKYLEDLKEMEMIRGNIVNNWKERY